MEEVNKLKYLEYFSRTQLNTTILPFWREHSIDNELGVFYGQINNNNTIVREAEKGQILNAPIYFYARAFVIYEYAITF